ncbi:hypothetical protein PENTCL1PPCAC_29246, partial [Pristionchus entomophagus]
SYENNCEYLAMYSGFKFEQYMTTEEPNGLPDTHTPVGNRPTFEVVFIISQRMNECFFRCNFSTVMQSEMVGVRSIVIGIKKGDIAYDNSRIVQVIEKSVEDIKSTVSIEQTTSQCFKVLSEGKKFLVSNDACEISFYPHRGV